MMNGSNNSVRCRNFFRRFKTYINGEYYLSSDKETKVNVCDKWIDENLMDFLGD